MKKILTLITLLLLSITSVSFAESDFSKIENSSMPSVMDFEEIYEEFDKKEEEFYVIDFKGGYTLPSLIKNPIINKLKSDIEKNSISSKDVIEDNYPELFENFKVEIVSCNDGSKFVALSEKNLVTQSSTVMKYAILGIVSLAIILMGFAYYKRSSDSKKRDKEINKNIEKNKSNRKTIYSSKNKEEISIEEYNKLKEENDKLKDRNAELKNNQILMAKDKEELLIEIEKRKNKEEELMYDFNEKKKEYLDQKRILSEQKKIELDRDAEMILNEKIRRIEKEFEDIKNKYNKELENINKEKIEMKKIEYDLEEKNKELVRQEIENEQKLESIRMLFKIIKNENNDTKVTEIMQRYKGILPKDISDQLYEAEEGFLKANSKRDYSSEVIPYTKMVEYMLQEATPQCLRNRKYTSAKARLKDLKSNTAISLKDREAYNAFYEDAELKGFFEIRNSSAHTKVVTEEELMKLRNFLFYDDIRYYGNNKEYRFDWLLRMVKANKNK